MQNSRNDRDRRRRRRRRATVILIYVAIAIGLAWFFESQATSTVIFVRHAEKDLSTGEDPSLSEAGRRRVEELTRQLVEADVVAGIDAIYVTPFRRSRETAEPLAAKLGLQMNVYDPDENEAVLETILQKHKGRIILVVAHSDTVPTLIADLGASKKVPPIAEDEYDNIYVVVIPWFGKTKTIRLRFGEPYRGPPGEARM
ncbi:MAG: phosphoglycerate mutase family protein [Steroidobacteraceae bacterium]